MVVPELFVTTKFDLILLVLFNVVDQTYRTQGPPAKWPNFNLAQEAQNFVFLGSIQIIRDTFGHFSDPPPPCDIFSFLITNFEPNLL